MLLYTVLFFSAGCGYDSPEEFVQKNKSEFKPVEQIGSPLVFPSHNLILYPFHSNHIKSGEEIFPFALKEKGGYSSMGDSYRTSAAKNFFIRDISDTGKRFQKLFSQELLIIQHYSFVSSWLFSSKATDEPYIIFHVVESDSNGNGIYDPENDLKSLYLFEFKSRSLKRISPKNVDIKHYKVSLKDDYSESSYGSFAKSQRNPLTSYGKAIITFRGSPVTQNSGGASAKNSETKKEPLKRYIYHIKTGKLERVKFPGV